MENEYTLLLTYSHETHTHTLTHTHIHTYIHTHQVFDEVILDTGKLKAEAKARDKERRQAIKHKQKVCVCVCVCVCVWIVFSDHQAQAKGVCVSGLCFVIIKHKQKVCECASVMYFCDHQAQIYFVLENPSSTILSVSVCVQAYVCACMCARVFATLHAQELATAAVAAL